MKLPCKVYEISLYDSFLTSFRLPLLHARHLLTCKCHLGKNRCRPLPRCCCTRQQFGIGYSTRGVVCSCILCRPSAFIKFLGIKYLWENYFNCIHFFPLQSSNDVSFTTPQQLKQFFIIVPSKLRLVTLAAFLLWKNQQEVFD